MLGLKLNRLSKEDPGLNEMKQNLEMIHKSV